MKLTKHYFESNHHLWKHDTKQEELLKPVHGDGYVCFVSNNEHIKTFYKNFKYTVVVDNATNMGDGWWNFHIDNADMNSVAGFSVQTLEQANQILGVYNMRLGNCDLYFDATWSGDEVIAEFAEPIISSLLRKTNSYPPTLTWSEWRRILRSIIFSLHQIQQERDVDAYDWYVAKYGPHHDDYWPKWEAYYNRVQQGLKYFGEYFIYLNW